MTDCLGRHDPVALALDSTCAPVYHNRAVAHVQLGALEVTTAWAPLTQFILDRRCCSCSLHCATRRPQSTMTGELPA